MEAAVLVLLLELLLEMGRVLELLLVLEDPMLCERLISGEALFLLLLELVLLLVQILELLLELIGPLSRKMLATGYALLLLLDLLSPLVRVLGRI